MNETIKTILERRSVRRYMTIVPPEDDIMQIVECGMYAATANGLQPWFFSVVKDRALLDSISEDSEVYLAEKGMDIPEDYDCFRGAPMAVIVSRDETAPFGEADCANATMNMAVAAASLGIGSCYIASFRPAVTIGERAAELCEKLNIPQGFVPCFALALGYSNTPLPPRKERVPGRMVVIDGENE